jgi:hypothetical protein
MRHQCSTTTMSNTVAELGSAHSRETRLDAREIKVLIDTNLAPRIQEWMRANLHPDANGDGPFRDQYATSSLYFDTEARDIFNRRGSYGRSKYRIRRYGLSPVMFLERKFRTDKLLAKRRTLVPVNEFGYLEGDTADPEWAGCWFHRRVLVRRLRPLVQLSYNRTARLGMSSTGPVRMTIDCDLRVLPLPDRAFIPGAGLPFLENQNVVELKYRVALPVVFKQLIADFRLEIQPVSKYRAGLIKLRGYDECLLTS